MPVEGFDATGIGGGDISAASLELNRTVFIVAHRLSAVRHCDRIVTLEQGRLVEEGSHDELLRAGGRYASLYRMQGGLHEAV